MAFADARAIDNRRVPTNIALLFQTAQPRLNRCFGESHPARELGDREPPVLGQGIENVSIDAVNAFCCHVEWGSLDIKICEKIVQLI